MKNAEGRERTHELATDDELLRASEIVTRLHEKHGMSYTDIAPHVYLSSGYLGYIARMENTSGSSGFSRTKVLQAIDLGGRLLDELDAPADEGPVKGNGNGAPSMLTVIGDTFTRVADRLDECVSDLEGIRDDVPHPLLRPGIEEMISRVREVRDLAAGETEGA